MQRTSHKKKPSKCCRITQTTKLMWGGWKKVRLAKKKKRKDGTRDRTEGTTTTEASALRTGRDTRNNAQVQRHRNLGGKIERKRNKDERKIEKRKGETNPATSTRTRSVSKKEQILENKADKGRRNRGTFTQRVERTNTHNIENINTLRAKQGKIAGHEKPQTTACARGEDGESKSKTPQKSHNRSPLRRRKAPCKEEG